MKGPELPSATRNNLLLTTAAFVIVVAGMREAQSLLVPFLLSGFIAVIAAPPMFWLCRHRVPTGLALLLVILGVVGIGMLVGGLVGSSVDRFSSQLPSYQTKLHEQTRTLVGWLSAHGVPISTTTFSQLLDPGKAMSMAALGLSSLGGLFANTFLILLTVIFMLFEASGFPRKLRAIIDEGSVDNLARVVEDIKRYMAIKSATSLLTGVAISLWLWVVGVDYPLLWGTLAFFLNFVPNIGSFIAAVPAVLLAQIQLGTQEAFWSLIGFLLINNLVGNFVEPRFMGRGLGLSSLVVFLSLVFWGWALGAVGMFLSVPLTMTVKIALHAREETRWIAILLGPDAPEEEAAPPEPCLQLPGLGSRDDT